MIIYTKLWDVLQAKNIPKTRLKTDKIVLGQSYTNLVNGESMTLNTLNKLCAYLHIQPGDILSYIPDDENA